MATEPIITIPFNEIMGSRTEGYDSDGRFAASCVLRCAYADRLTLATQMLGGPLLDSSGASVGYALPARHPDNPEARVVSITPIRPDGKAAASSTPGYIDSTYAHLTVNYGVSWVTFTQSDSGYRIEDRIDEAIEFLTIPADNLWWTAEDVRVTAESSPQKKVELITWSRTVRGIETVPAAVFDYAGLVNNSEFTCPAIGITSLTFPVETLLMDAPRLSREYTPDGDPIWRIDLTFRRRYFETVATPRGTDITHGGWNHFFQPGKSIPERIYSSPLGAVIYKPYELASIESLITELS